MIFCMYEQKQLNLLLKKVTDLDGSAYTAAWNELLFLIDNQQLDKDLLDLLCHCCSLREIYLDSLHVSF